MTPELLYARMVVLTERAARVAGEPEELLLRRIICDRCGTIVDLRAEPFPVGWTSAGCLERGFTDLCRGCSS